MCCYLQILTVDSQILSADCLQIGLLQRLSHPFNTVSYSYTLPKHVCAPWQDYSVAGEIL